MSERDPLVDVLERLEHPVAPSERFTEDLLAELLAELEPGGPAPSGRGPRPRLSPTWRRILTVAAAFAVALAGLAFLRPLAHLNDAPAVPASVGEIGPFAPVSFRGTVVEGWSHHTTRTPIGDVTYVSQFSWSVAARGDYLQGAVDYPFGDAGAVSRDGDVVTLYSSSTNSTRSVPVRSASIAPEYSPAKLLTWGGTQAFSWAEACASGRIVGPAHVDGSEAVRVHCPHVRFRDGLYAPFRMTADVWVDLSTGIVLRFQTAGAATEGSHRGSFLGPDGPGQRWELSAVQVGEVASTAFAPPSDAIDATHQTVLTSVRLGQPMPRIELPLVTGGTASLSGTPGRPTALLFWDRSCYGHDCSPLTQIRELTSRSDIAVVVVVDPMWTNATEIRRALAPAHVSVPVAIDPHRVASGLVTGETNSSGPNILLLLDPSGNLEGAYGGNYGPILNDILDAFASGRPLPPAPPSAQAELP